MIESHTRRGGAFARRLALALVAGALGVACSLGVASASAQATGAISGAVTNSSGAPLAEASVVVYDGALVAASAITAADGSYTVGSLAPGSYTVSFTPPQPVSGMVGTANPENYLPQTYDGKSPDAAGDAVTVAAGVTTAGIDASLQAGGTISGVVLDPSGSPLAGVNVDIAGSDGASPEGAYGTATAADGTFTIDRLPTDTYALGVDPGGLPGLDLASGWLGGTTTIAGAYGVSVTAGETTGGITIQLQPGGNIAGRVTEASNAGASGEVAIAFDSSGEEVAGDGTGSDGTYTITGLARGTYRVGFFPAGGPSAPGPNYLPAYFGGTSLADATPVTVTPGSTATGVNQQVSPGGEITGKVTDPNGDPVANTLVAALDGSDDAIDSVVTGSDGTYTLTGLPTGTYELQFTPGFTIPPPATPPNLAPQVYGGGDSLAEATPVAVTAGAATTGIDVQLPAGASISGTVTDSLGMPLADVLVDAYDDTGVFVAQAGSANITGDYSIADLPAGTYRLEFVPLAGAIGNWAPQFSGDEPSLATATTITVTVGGSAGGVDAELQPGGEISGRVTDSAGAPLSRVRVSALDANGQEVTATTSGTGGLWTIDDLAAGSYRIEFQTALDLGPPVIQSQFYGGTSLESASPVALAAGGTTAGIDATVTVVTGGISGSVTSGSGGPVAGAQVTVYNTSGTAVGAAATASDGTYTVDGLDPGFYRVGFSLAGYQANFFTGSTSLPSAQSFYVYSATTASNIDGVLEASPGGGQQQPQQQQPPPAAAAQSIGQGQAASGKEFISFIGTGRLKLSKRDIADIDVRCIQSSRCRGTVVAVASNHGRTLTVGRASLTIAGKHAGKVKLIIDGRGIKLFDARHHRLSVTVTIILNGVKAATVRESLVIT